VWSSECLKGIVRDDLMTLVKWCLCETVFSPQNVVQVLDLFGGMVNFQGIYVLQWIESGGAKYVQDLIIPSVSTLCRFIAKFTGFASQKISVKLISPETGEGFEFDEKQLIQLIWKATGNKKNNCLLITLISPFIQCMERTLQPTIGICCHQDTSCGS